MKRLFIAIDLPDEMREKIYSIHREIPDVNWVKKEQIHLTLRFIGDADDELFTGIKSTLEKILWKKFHLGLNETGFFPNEKRPNVFWVGLGKNEALSSLKNRIDQILEEVGGVSSEGRNFLPHVTIARIKRRLSEKDISGFSDISMIIRSFNIQPFLVDKFFLYSSILTAHGAIHSVEAEYKAS